MCVHKILARHEIKGIICKKKLSNNQLVPLACYTNSHERNLRILVFGASVRRSRSRLQALEAGHSVTAFVRTMPEHSALPLHEKLHFITGDARNYTNVLQAMSDQDAVINVIAPKLGDSANYDISLVATRNIIQAMQEQGIKRYQGQSGAWAAGEYLEDASIPMRIAFSLLHLSRTFTHSKA